MTYRQLIRTLEIAASHRGGLDTECLDMWAEHDEHGINIKSITAKEARELSEMGWLLGCDVEYNEEDQEIWENPSKHTDEELLEIYNNYGGVYKYE